MTSGVLSSPKLRADLCVVSRDEELYALARSNIDPEILDIILPARTARGRSILGSKVGLVQAVNEMNEHQVKVAQPRSVTFDSGFPATAAFPCVIKGDSGGGGRHVRIVCNPQELTTTPIPPEWYPIVVQEFIEGDAVSAEALFFEGRLLGYLYSTVEAQFTVLGHSTVRRFRSPPDTQVEQALRSVGAEFGLHGFANSTFMKDHASGEHLLIELDMRPNRFHQYGPLLGVDWIEVLLAQPQHPATPPDLPSEGRLIHNFPLDLAHGLKSRSFATVKPWLTRSPGTWDARNHRDRAVNIKDFKFLIKRGLGLSTFTLTRRPAP